MLRHLETKFLIRGKGLFISNRVFSAQAAKAVDLSFENEWKNAKPFESIPAMTKLSLLRSFLPGGDFSKISLAEMHRILKQNFGIITKFPSMLGKPEMVMTFNVEDAEKVFRFEGQFPYRRSIETLDYYRQKIRPDIYGEYGSLLSEQNENWYKMRTLINPVLLKPATVKLYVPQVDDVSKDFIKLITKKRDANNEVPANFSDYVNMWSLESITCISLNQRIGILNENNTDEHGEKLIKLIREFFLVSFEFEVNPSIWRYYQTKAFKKLLSVYDDMTNTVLHYVDKAIEDLKTQKLRDDREESILEKLVKINKNVAVVMCSDAMLAGVDTTSSALIGVLYCLAKNPEKQEKLREELKTILPNNHHALTPEIMRNMPYLRAVIKEGIRMFPPTSGNMRKTGNDLVLSGYRIPKGTDVLLGLLLANKDENNFAKPDEFIPERWLKSNTDPQCPHAKDAHPFSYLPFGFGARMCPGIRLANLEMEVLITRLIRDYKFEWNHPDMKIKSVFVNIPDGDLKFKMTEV